MIEKKSNAAVYTEQSKLSNNFIPLTVSLHAFTPSFYFHGSVGTITVHHSVSLTALIDFILGLKKSSVQGDRPIFTSIQPSDSSLPPLLCFVYIP